MFTRSDLHVPATCSGPPICCSFLSSHLFRKTISECTICEGLEETSLLATLQFIADLYVINSLAHADCIQYLCKWYINLLKPTGHVMHQQFNIQQLYVLSTLYLCVLYLSENKSDFCHLQHKLIGFYNRDGKCLLRGTNCVFK